MALDPVTKFNKTMHLQLASRAYSTLCLRDVDSHHKPAEALGWNIHKHAQTCSKHSLIPARHPRANLRGCTAPLTQGRQKRLSFARHCHRAAGSPPVCYRGLIFSDMLSRDAGVEQEDLPAAMANRRCGGASLSVLWPQGSPDDDNNDNRHGQI